MKKLLIALIVLCVLGVTFFMIMPWSNKKPTMTAAQLTSKLKEANLPIYDVIVYNESNDVNKLLGRPNQYISKVNFADKRLEQFDLKNNPDGATIETFNNTTDLNARKEYLESIMKASPVFTEYMVVNGNYLLRLSKDLTNEQVNKYKQAFMAIK